MKFRQLCGWALLLLCLPLSGRAAPLDEIDLPMGSYFEALSPVGQRSYAFFTEHEPLLMTGEPLEVTALLGEDAWARIAQDDWQSAEFVALLDGLSSFYYDDASRFYLEPRRFYFTMREGRAFFTHPPDWEGYLSGDDTPTEIAARQQQLAVQVADYAEKAGAYPDQADQISYVYRRLIAQTQYDASFLAPDIHNAYGALVNGEAVCDGFALALQAVLRALEIPCAVVRGDRTETLAAEYGAAHVQALQVEQRIHMWNAVQLDGEWYLLDAAWEAAGESLAPLTEREGEELHFFLRGQDAGTHTDFVPCALSDKSDWLPYPPLSPESPQPQSP